LADPPPNGGPWLLVQLLESPPANRRDRYPSAVGEALAAHGLEVTDVHPAVDTPDVLLVRCPAANLPADTRLRHATELVARLLHLPSAQTVRIAAYEDLAAAHRAAGDR
jgi:hypothetical protein